MDGGGVFAGDTGQIFHRVAAAHGLQRGDHVLGHFAFVKAFAAFAGHAAQNFGLTGGAEDLANTGGLVVDEVVAAGRALQGGGVVGPVKSHAGGDGDAGVGIVDGRGDDAIQPQLAVAVREAAERLHRAGQGDGVSAAQGHGGEATGAQGVGRGARRGAA